MLAVHEKVRSMKAQAMQSAVDFKFSLHEVDLIRILIASDYWYEQIIRHPEWLLCFFSGEHKYFSSKACAITFFNEMFPCSGECDEGVLYKNLRIFRHFHICRLIKAEVLESLTINQSTVELSYLAAACLQIALDYYEHKLSLRYGAPCDAQGNMLHFIIFGMGKLGANELNLSSDIDLIFAYDAEGQTSSPSANRENNLSAGEFFGKLGQSIIRILSGHTEEGFVYRVDMRLRPFGVSGPLASAFSTMLDYYREEGRPWERYAMLKASVVAGNESIGAKFLTELKPFIYRKYTDFSTLNDLREMKQLISRELLRKDDRHNVKLGLGGIREIEFVVQVIQLMRGGKDVRLQRPHLLPVLEVLVAGNYMDEQDAGVLKSAYLFLRKVEHRLQAKRDLQTHKLPQLEEDQYLLAHSLAFDDYESFLVVLNDIQHQVHTCFEKVIEPSRDHREENPLMGEFEALWESTFPIDVSGFFPAITENKAEINQGIQDLRDSFRVKKMTPQARLRLNQLMPILLYKLHVSAHHIFTVQRVLGVVESVLRRSVYLSMLVENPEALNHLILLCERSIWVADKITEFPLLLDELLNASRLFFPPKRDWLEDELRQLLLRLPEADIENQMEVLRQFKHVHSLRVAAADLAGNMHIMKVSDYLSWLAEICIRSALSLAWQEVCAKFNVLADKREMGPDFAVVAYGKLGGIELGYESDLDLVFLYDADAELVDEQKEALDPSSCYTRLAQKLIHILTAKTYSGAVYEVDMRLRPSGNAGLLVSSLSAFQNYQQNTAWVWEHQALVRTRPVAGSLEVGDAFLRMRKEILCQKRDEALLKNEVILMRQKMLVQFNIEAKKESHVECVHLKQSLGGMIDIEFMIQFLALKNAYSFPQIAFYSDNVRILDQAENLGCLSRAACCDLKEHYLLFRETNHRLSLQKKNGWVERSLFYDQFCRVQEIWCLLFES